MKRNETQPIAFQPKIEPAKTSWWMEPKDRQTWYQRATQEAARMTGSKDAHKLTPRMID
jgi:hypothetical protein